MLLTALAVSAMTACSGAPDDGVSITVATVNNSDMMRLKTLSREFEKTHPKIHLNWVALEENVLRQRVTTDVATRAAQFDVVTIGSYEVPMWARQGWLAKLDQLGPDYAANDLIPAMRQAISVDGIQYAAPFNGESSITYYRQDLFRKAGLVMPAEPKWDFIVQAARKLHAPAHGTYGICLRGKAGWGENMSLLNTMAHSFGASFFDMNWRPQFDTPQWKTTVETWSGLIRDFGPPGAVANGFNENLSLFASAKCAMWIDSTVGAPVLADPRSSGVADKVGFAAAPDAGLGRRASWLWTWALAVPAASRKAAAAQQFVAWATGPAYAKLVASREGWGNVPPGTRISLYANPEYRKLAPYAEVTLAAIAAAHPADPAIRPVPYTGIQYVSIPEWQGIGSETGRIFSGVLAGTTTVDAALAEAQSATLRQMAKARK
ncbi:sugar ABC transporter substrate-binding protein [Novosphingobium flavum]|uniref:Sugar ABC transporter substrate-binding protein n=2 Tax=Novosphingobium flavum TaxID=1778672 RepID=A0A7X1FR44_9SPHN|nr:sugar ABC transporter substrate-binding protein [Novosphingobium flavum]